MISDEAQPDSKIAIVSTSHANSPWSSAASDAAYATCSAEF